MNVIFTCGGTGGHINPAIAVANLLKERCPEANILFVGAEDGMEKDLVPRAGFELKTVKIANFQRKLTPSGIAHNIRALSYMMGSRRTADRIIDDFRPDVIVGTGGYASYPMLKQGARRKVPTALHEANAVPGLTTKLVMNDVDRVMVSYEESKAAYPDPDRVEVVGMPVRGEFLYTKKAEARAALGIGDEPLVVSFWGSLGAREMNKMIAKVMAISCEKGVPFRHIHAAGSFGYKWMPEYVKEQGADLEQNPKIEMREYIYDMPTVMAAADLVICRAGAATISEVAAAGKPAIFVPSPNVTDNHQEKNARILENRGGAVVIRESECDGQRLYDEIMALLGDKKRLEDMGKAAEKMAVPDSTERIYSLIRELAGK